MTGRDPKSIIADDTMRAGQWLAVLVTVGLNALDGFDVLSISFASPGIAKDWGIDKATLGWVLSMELFGMAFGSVLLGGVADKIGRRPTILGCLVAMAIGMFGAGHAHGVADLLAWRLLTGLGIGGTLASINATAAELTNRRWRNFALALMVIGYPLGGVIGGLFVQKLLASASWHAVFIAGGWATGAFLPIVWLLVPESVAFLDRRRGPGALEQINRILARFGHAPASVLSGSGEAAARRSIADILKPGLLATTVLITFAYFAHITSFYFILKWVPKIVVDMGFAPQAAAGVLTWVERRRCHRGRDLRPDRHARRGEAADHLHAAGRLADDCLVRPRGGGSFRSEGHAGRHRPVHQRGDRGFLPLVRAGVSDTRARDRHRLCHRCGSRRRGARTGHRRIPLPGGPRAEDRGRDHGQRLAAGRGGPAGAQGA